MRRAEKEITDRAEIDAIIESAPVMRLGLADGTEPYVVPLSFGYDGRSLFFHCAAQGRKTDIIGRNSRVCFEMDELLGIVDSGEACRWSARYRSVIGTGTAGVVTDAEEKRRGLAAIMAHYSDREHAFPEGEVSGVCVVRIDVSGVTGKRSGA